LFAKSERRIQIIKAYLNGNFGFCENQLKVSYIQEKIMLTP